jgi:hypothetical protein
MKKCVVMLNFSIVLFGSVDDINNDFNLWSRVSYGMVGLQVQHISLSKGKEPSIA